jgi:hypothetical protein
MSKTLAIGLSAVGVIVFVLFFLLFGYIGFGNTANGFETDIKAKYTDNKNVYDNGWKRVKELAQVPDMQVEGLQKLYDATMKGRYGANGSQAVLQFITEQNPALDQSTYRAIQQNIESFRLEFQANQTRLISIKQQYERFLTATTGGRFYNMIGGYPRIDLSQFDIVTSEKTEEDFKNKKSDPIQLREK